MKNDKSMFPSSQSQFGVIEISLSQLDTSKALTEWLVTVKIDKSMFSSSQSELRVIEISLSQLDTSKPLTEW